MTASEDGPGPSVTPVAEAAEPLAQVTGGKTDRTDPTVLRRKPASLDVRSLSERPWYRSGPAALGGVLGLILLVSYVARRCVPAVRALGSGVLRVVQRVPLSGKQSLALVQIGRRLVLIGITPDRINPLSVIDDAEECAHLHAGMNTAGGPCRPEFERMLSREAGKFDDDPVEAPIDAAGDTGRLRDTRQHLDRMLKKLKGMELK